MDHIVQFAIGIDDDAIRKRIEQNAEKQIIDRIHKSLQDEIFHYNTWDKTKPSGLSEAAREMIERIIESYKDEIIRMAAKELVESMRRTKAFKEAVSRAVEEGE